MTPQRPDSAGVLFSEPGVNLMPSTAAKPKPGKAKPPKASKATSKPPRKASGRKR